MVIRLDAQNDIAGAHNNYLAQDSKRAPDFLLALEEALLFIEANPGAYAIRPHGIRRFNLKKFPYALLYVVVEHVTAEGEPVERIVLIGCFHEKQDVAPFRARLNP